MLYVIVNVNVVLLHYLNVIRGLLFCDRKKTCNVKDAMRQLLNRYKKRLQENVHKVSKHILPLSVSNTGT